MNNNYNDEKFYKKNVNDTIWWIDNPDKVGEHLFTFDKKKIYNLFRDYPKKLSKKEKKIFDKENPYWADFFKKEKAMPSVDKKILLTIGIIYLFLCISMYFFKDFFIKPCVPEALFGCLYTLGNRLAYMLLFLLILITAIVCITHMGYIIPMVTSVLIIFLSLIFIGDKNSYPIPFITLSIFSIVTFFIEFVLLILNKRTSADKNRKEIS